MLAVTQGTQRLTEYLLQKDLVGQERSEGEYHKKQKKKGIMQRQGGEAGKLLADR